MRERREAIGWVAGLSTMQRGVMPAASMNEPYQTRPPRAFGLQSFSFLVLVLSIRRERERAGSGFLWFSGAAVGQYRSGSCNFATVLFVTSKPEFRQDGPDGQDGGARWIQFKRTDCAGRPGQNPSYKSCFILSSACFGCGLPTVRSTQAKASLLSGRGPVSCVPSTSRFRFRKIFPPCAFLTSSERPRRTFRRPLHVSRRDPCHQSARK